MHTVKNPSNPEASWSNCFLRKKLFSQAIADNKTFDELKSLSKMSNYMEHLAVDISHQFPTANVTIPYAKEGKKRCFNSMRFGAFTWF